MDAATIPEPLTTKFSAYAFGVALVAAAVAGAGFDMHVDGKLRWLLFGVGWFILIGAIVASSLQANADRNKKSTKADGVAAVVNLAAIVALLIATAVALDQRADTDAAANPVKDALASYLETAHTPQADLNQASFDVWAACASTGDISDSSEKGLAIEACTRLIDKPIATDRAADTLAHLLSGP